MQGDHDHVGFVRAEEAGGELDRHGILDQYERQRRVREQTAAQAGALGQYVGLQGEFAEYLKDPYTPPSEPRAPRLGERHEVLIIGGGFSSLLTTVRLREAGVEDTLILEKGGDVGGTWYWNRYPGAACDVESYSYLPLLEESGYVPSRKYAGGPEIFAYCRKVAQQYNIYRNCIFHTTATETTWDEDSGQWSVRTDCGDLFLAKYVIMANGCLSEPKLAVIEGMQRFKGKAFHTSRWDYAFTGGSPDGGLVGLRDKVVGIIGTGATAVQSIPHLAEHAAHLFVFQRTPSSIDVRGDFPTDPEWAGALKPGWSLRRRQVFDDSMSNGFTRVDLSVKASSKEELRSRYEESNLRAMEQIRRRVDAVVQDPKTSAALKPWYPLGCKRPCVHDEYLPTFNRPNVTLVDTEGAGVRLINEQGPVVNGNQYTLDVLIYATGFDFCKVGTFNSIIGRQGLRLGDKWRGGISTFLGIHTRGFPNLFIMGGPQAFGATFNFMSLLERQGEHVARVVAHCRHAGVRALDVGHSAEEEYVAFCVRAASKAPYEKCVSYYNAEGTARAQDLPYSASGKRYFQQLSDAQAGLAGKHPVQPYIFH